MTYPELLLSLAEVVMASVSGLSAHYINSIQKNKETKD